MEARFTNGFSVTRVHAEDDLVAGDYKDQTELIAAFEYGQDALEFASAKLEQDTKHGKRKHYIIADSRTGMVQLLCSDSSK